MRRLPLPADSGSCNGIDFGVPHAPKITVLVVYRIPQLLVSGMQILLYEKRGIGSPLERIICHPHGGGYVVETVHPAGATGRVVKHSLHNSSSPFVRRPITVEYRLSSPG